jgi:hypothetical protein
MNPDVLKIAAMTAGTLMSVPVISLAYFVGKLVRMVDELATSFKGHVERVEKLLGDHDLRLSEHNQRITRVETQNEERNVGPYGRRATDFPPDDLPSKGR